MRLKNERTHFREFHNVEMEINRKEERHFKGRIKASKHEDMYTASFDNGLTGETISNNTIFGMLKLLEQNHWKIKWIYYYYSRIKTDDIPNGIVNGNRAQYNSTTFRNPKYNAHILHIAHSILECCTYP